MIPYKALYGQDPPPIIRGPNFPPSIEAVNELVEDKDTIFDRLHTNLVMAQQRIKKEADKCQTDV